MAPTDLGTELWILAYHLFSRYRASGRAFEELTLRTRCECSESDRGKAISASELPATSWYTEMCKRYQDVCQRVREEHADELAEAADLVKSCYPGGCALSEYGDAVQTITAMLSFTIPSEKVLAFATMRGAALGENGQHEVGLDQLTTTIVDELLLQAILPQRWWDSSVTGTRTVKVLRIAMRAHPPEVVLQYERPIGHPRCRRILLEKYLQQTGPTAPLARRLALAHDALLAEPEWQRVLVKLQRMMQVAAEDAKVPSKVVAAPPLASSSELIPGAEGRAKGETAVSMQKADLGLLYRDPERALENVDLNDADDMTLREFKEVMDEKFKANAVRPGDPGYVYDKRIEVGKPTERSEWDDSDSD